MKQTYVPRRATISILLCATLALGGIGALTGCGSSKDTEEGAAVVTVDGGAGASSQVTALQMYENGILDTSDMFSERDLTQTADLSDATSIQVTSGEDVTISEEGVYVLSGAAEGVTIAVDAGDSAKVQLVLDGLAITNDDSPAIYVASADKVFITTAEGSNNTLKVTDSFTAGSDSESSIDSVIFAKDDITLNGLGSLTIESSDNGIVGKDDIRITGGTYQITTTSGHAIEGKDSVRVAGGDFTFNTGKDGIHTENADDQSLGYVYICGGTFSITAESDGIEGDSVVQVDGGSLNIRAVEGIEGTYVQINGGTIDISASDDGINSTSKSTAYDVVLEINGGDITVTMDAGDTDALDSNGNLIINGGNLDITAQSPFDYDGTGELNVGTVIVNGEQVSQLTNQFMGGMEMGGMPGDMDMGDMPGDMGGMGGPQGDMGAQGQQGGPGGGAPGGF